MKRSTDKAVLLAAACTAVYVDAYVLFVKPLSARPHLGFFQAPFLLVYSFGVLASLLLFRAARWACVAVGAIAFSTALLLSWITVRLLVVFLPSLKTPDSKFMVVGIQLSSWEFLMLLAMFAVVALGYVIFGSWILKRRACCPTSSVQSG